MEFQPCFCCWGNTVSDVSDSGAPDADGEAGLAVEDLVRRVAAEFGVPDFVYFPKKVRRGTALKEIGDGILLCGDRGAIVQVKSRGASVAEADSEIDAERWAKRELRKAVKQALWSRNELHRRWQSDEPVILRPVRALDVPERRQVEFDCELSVDPRRWPAIVVLDHPSIDGISVEMPSDDVFTITSVDWAELQRALRSVAGLLEYVDRCLDQRDVLEMPLGEEFERFNALCEADSATDDSGPTWGPWLSFAALEDPSAADVYQHIINRCWPAGEPLPGIAPVDYRRFSEFLDEVPPTVRVVIGERWRAYAEATRTGGQASGMSILPDKAVFALFHHDPTAELDPRAMQGRLRAIAHVRYWEIREALGARPLMAIGVFTHPEGTDYIQLIAEDLDPPDDEMLAEVEEDIGRLSIPDGYERLSEDQPSRE